MKLTVFEVERPALSVTEHVKLTPGVSVDCVVVLQPVVLATPDMASLVPHVTCTGPRYQPLLPAVPVSADVTTGGVASRFTVCEPVAERPAPVTAEQV